MNEKLLKSAQSSFLL